MHAWTGSYVLALAGLLLGTERAPGQASCDLLLKHGIYDVRQNPSDSERRKSLTQWIKRETSRNYESQNSSGGFFGIPVGHVIVGGGYNNDQYGYEEFRESLNSYEQLDEHERERVEEVAKTINARALDAWTRCLGAFGLHAQALYTADPNRFDVAVLYVTAGYRAVRRRYPTGGSC